MMLGGDLRKLTNFYKISSRVFRNRCYAPKNKSYIEETYKQNYIKLRQTESIFFKIRNRRRIFKFSFFIWYSAYSLSYSFGKKKT